MTARAATVPVLGSSPGASGRLLVRPSVEDQQHRRSIMAADSEVAAVLSRGGRSTCAPSRFPLPVTIECPSRSSRMPDTVLAVEGVLWPCSGPSRRRHGGS